MTESFSLFQGYISFGTKWEFNQNMEFNPLNFYSATKHANDIFFNYFSQKKNICTVSLKIFDTYGPDDPIIPIFIFYYNKLNYINPSFLFFSKIR